MHGFKHVLVCMVPNKYRYEIGLVYVQYVTFVYV